MTSLQHGEGPRFESEWLYSFVGGGEVAERSKALRQGRNLFGGVGSNPTLVTLSGRFDVGPTRRFTPLSQLPPGNSDHSTTCQRLIRKLEIPDLDRVSPTSPTRFPSCDRMAEWSKAPDSSSGLFGGAGSNPAPVMCSFCSPRQTTTPAWIRTLRFEPGLPDSRSGVLTTTLQELLQKCGDAGYRSLYPC